jgi:hypothetical protein
MLDLRKDSVMNDDSMDLPVRRTDNVPATRAGQVPSTQTRFSEKQVDAMITHGAKVLESAASIARDLTEIARVRATSEAEVTVIEARTRALRELVRGEVDRLDAMRQTIGKRGDVAVQIIQAVLPQIPESDRLNAMEELRKMIDSAIADKGAAPTRPL